MKAKTQAERNLEARIAKLDDQQLVEAIEEIVKETKQNPNRVDIVLVRVMLFDAYEERKGEQALDALFDRLGV